MLKTTQASIKNGQLHLQLCQARERIEYASRQCRQSLGLQGPVDAVRSTSIMAWAVLIASAVYFHLSTNSKYQLQCPPERLVCRSLGLSANTAHHTRVHPWYVSIARKMVEQKHGIGARLTGSHCIYTHSLQSDQRLSRLPPWQSSMQCAVSLTGSSSLSAR